MCHPLHNTQHKTQNTAQHKTQNTAQHKTQNTAQHNTTQHRNDNNMNDRHAAIASKAERSNAAAECSKDEGQQVAGWQPVSCQCRT
jgi:hypothetical protein